MSDDRDVVMVQKRDSGASPIWFDFGFGRVDLHHVPDDGQSHTVHVHYQPTETRIYIDCVLVSGGSWWQRWWARVQSWRS